MRAEVDSSEPFGPYLVYERLGIGGMATVHRALERGIEGFERIVALKRLLPHIAEDASFIKAFVREAKLASALNHVNVVQIFELGRVGSEYFISMEHIDGRDIRRILRHARKVTGPPPIAVTVGLLLQLCDALDYAHTKIDEHGVPMLLVHRDVSPSNVLVTSGGTVKVIDFGIAKAQSSTLRTQTGRVKGKLAYMAPEAISGRELDARSDLFAVGVIAHELLTARPLFASKNEYQTLLKVQRGDIMPPSTFNQSCPPELDAIVLEALARDPDERYASAADLRDALLALRQQYKLQTGQRDIAHWVDWAFGLEIPAEGFSGPTSDQQSLSIDRSRTPGRPTPRPRKSDDEAAVDMAWGGGHGGEESASGPVIMDDVPDVSGKHLAPHNTRSSGARGLFEDEPDGDELDDDIPTPAPSHGVRPVAQGTARALSPASRDSRPSRPSGNSLLDALHAANESAATLHELRTADPDAVSTQPAMPRVDPNAATTQPSFPTFDDRSASDAMPIVRFRPPSIPPQAVEIPSLAAPAHLPKNFQTKPGHSPARAATVSPTIPPAIVERPPIGAAVVTRGGPRKSVLVVAGLLAAGAVATAATLFVTRGHRVKSVVEQPATQISANVGTVKFELEPKDAEVTIAGSMRHTGSPWEIELAAGVHQIQIQKSGYKAWLTALELSPNETETLRVVLEPLTNAATVADATLVLRSSPPNLEAYLDGKPLAVRTPIRMPLTVGPHSVALRQAGVEVWHQDLVAQANASHEFNAELTKRAKPVRRAIEEPGPVEVKPLAPTPVPPSPAVAVALPVDAAPVVPVVPPPVVTPPPVVAKPPPMPAPTVAKALPSPTPSPLARVVPPTIPPSAVAKLSGDLPELSKTKHGDIPPTVAAKICIDHTGGVTSADLISKLEARAHLEMVQTLKTWRYAPYKVSGRPTAACFAVSFRTK